MESTFSWLWIKEYASQDGNGAGAMASRKTSASTTFNALIAVVGSTCATLAKFSITNGHATKARPVKTNEATGRHCASAPPWPNTIAQTSLAILASVAIRRYGSPT